MSSPSVLLPLARDFARFAGARLWGLMALMLLGAVVEGFGLLMIVPLAAAATGESGQLPRFFASIVDSLSADSRFAGALILFLGAMALRSAILFARDVLRGQLQADYGASLQLRAAASLADRSWAEASRFGQAEIQSLLLNDVPRATLSLFYCLEVILALVLLCVQILLVALLSAKFAMIAIVVLAPAFLLLKLMAPRLVSRGKAISDDVEKSTGAGQRLQAGLKAAMAQGTVPRFLDEYRVSLHRLADTATAYSRDLATSRQLTALVSALAAAFLLYVGTRVLDLPFATLLAALVLFARMMGPATSLVGSAQAALAAAPAFMAIERRLGTIATVPQTSESHAPAPLGWSRLVVENAAYRHPSGGGVGCANLTIDRGEWVGIDGASAAGKTTLADLVTGLLDPLAGTIRIDGRPLEPELLRHWRSSIAYVAQDGLVFDDSVAANLGADRGAVSDQECWDVLDAVDLAARIRSFPAQLREPLGQHGSSLSGGERQRLLIARALLRSPSFIVLDEATAALDVASEAALIGRLKALPSRPAAIVIAHRPSTLATCDSIITIQHGVAGRQERRR